ncbi:MAG: ABC transporter permease [Verrucomicrobiae bacterium]|nr:ABC transporter permease [Verrucomicrobiae bacterium]
MNNPILQRELISLLRARATVVLVWVYLVLLGGLVLWMWPETGVYSLAARTSRSLLVVFTVTQVLLVVVYAPAFAATSITLEREQNTYDLLFATRLRPFQIVIGKLGASISTLLMFVVLALPLFATCFFLGAISVRETLIILAVVSMTAVFFGLLGLAVSAVAGSSHGAMVATYVLVLLLGAGPWVPHLLLRHQVWAQPFTQQIRALSPVAAMLSVVSPAHEATAAWQLYLLFTAAGSVVLGMFLVGSVYLRRTRPPRPHGKTITDPDELRRRKLRFPFYLIDPMRRKQPIPDWINPVFAKELRSQALGGGIWLFRAAYTCFAVSVLLMAAVAGNLVGQTPDVIRVVAVVFQLGMVVLVVPSLTAGAVTQERERGCLDLLRMARIRPASLLSGKLGVALLFMSFLVVGSAPGWAVIYALQTNTLREIGYCWTVILATMVLGTMIGLAASALMPRTSVATALAYGVMGVLTVATLLPLLMGDQLAAPAREAVLMFNPIIAAIQTLAPGVFPAVGEIWRAHLKWSVALSALCAVLAYGRVHRLLRRGT